MIVVSDSSPVIAMSSVEQLDILRLLYNEVLIPEKVWQEITFLGKSGSVNIRNSEWIRVCPPTGQAMVKLLEAELDSGEAEAITLALEVRAELLLIDERKGRTLAEHMGLNIIGVLGILT